MLGDGVADAATIDRVCRLGGGFRMGPFELIDLIGLDVNLSVARSFYAQGGEPERWRPSPIQERLVGEGRLGRKSGQGYYDYGDGRPPRARPRARASRRPTLDPDELAKIDPAAAEILPRLFAQIANEAAFALEEEVGSPADMDTAMRLGFNWPLRPARAHRADRRRARGRAARGAAGRARRGLPPGARPARRRGSRRERARKPATEPPRAQPRGAARCHGRRGGSRRRGLIAASTRRRSRTRTAARSGSWSPTTSSTASRPTPPTPASGARPAQPHRRPLRARARLLPAARLRPLEHARGRGRARASSSSTRWSRPRPRPRRSPSTASTAASARSPG